MKENTTLETAQMPSGVSRIVAGSFAFAGAITIGVLATAGALIRRSTQAVSDSCVDGYRSAKGAFHSVNTFLLERAPSREATPVEVEELREQEIEAVMTDNQIADQLLLSYRERLLAARAGHGGASQRFVFLAIAKEVKAQHPITIAAAFIKRHIPEIDLVEVEQEPPPPPAPFMTAPAM